MHIVKCLWASMTFIVSIATLSPIHNSIYPRSPQGNPSNVAPSIQPTKGPGFHPPGGFADDFGCQYPSMVGWESCSTPTDRKCWLKRTSDGKQFDIFTNYEEEMPIGVTRYYELELEDGSFDADGIDFPFAKMFNHQYPGPWIQACWGDT